MNSLFCYCCQELLNLFPQNNKGKRVMWKIYSHIKKTRSNVLSLGPREKQNFKKTSTLGTFDLAFYIGSIPTF